MIRHCPPCALVALAAALLIGTSVSAQDGITMSNFPKSETVLVLSQATSPAGGTITYQLSGVAQVDPPFLVSRIELEGMPGCVACTSTPLPAPSTSFTVDLSAFVPANTNLEQDIRLRFYKQEFPGIGHETRFAEAHALVIFSCQSQTPAPVVVVRPGLLQQRVLPSASATMTDIQFSVMNRDAVARTVDLTLSQSLGWTILTPLPASVLLSPGETADFLLDVLVPGALPLGTANLITLTAAFAGVPASATSGSWNVSIANLTAYDYADGDGFEVQLRLNGEDASDYPDQEVPVFAPYDVNLHVFNVFGDTMPFMLLAGSDVQPGMLMVPGFDFMQIDLVAPTMATMAFTPFVFPMSFPPSVAGTCGPGLQAWFFDRQLGSIATSDAAQPCFF